MTMKTWKSGILGGGVVFGAIALTVLPCWAEAPSLLAEQAETASLNRDIAIKNTVADARYDLSNKEYQQDRTKYDASQQQYQSQLEDYRQQKELYEKDNAANNQLRQQYQAKLK